MQALPINWKTEFVLVTPQDATRLLDRNEGNRRLRPGVVERYTATIAAGNWMLSPQPIIIADTGRILDGQHRLVAVERLGVSVPFTIISNVPESVFPVLDRGATRSSADALGIDPKLAEVAKVLLSSFRPSAKVLDAEIGAVSALLSDDFADLMAACNTSTRFFSSAPMRAAATVRMFAGYNRDFVLRTYRALVLGQMNDLHPAAQAMVAAVAANRLRTTGGGTAIRSEILARAWDVFDDSKTDNARVQIKDPRTRIDQIKRIIDAALATQNVRAAA